MGTSHCDQASLTALCHRVRYADHGARSFRRDIPLRLRIGSKAGEVFEFFVVSHEAPPRVRLNSEIVQESTRYCNKNQPIKRRVVRILNFNLQTLRRYSGSKDRVQLASRFEASYAIGEDSSQSFSNILG
jgi:hypothetical protein